MLVAEYDYDTDIAVQKQESLMIGIKRGFADGTYQNKLETAKLMRNENLGIDLIAKVTGLSKEEIAKL